MKLTKRTPEPGGARRSGLGTSGIGASGVAGADAGGAGDAGLPGADALAPLPALPPDPLLGLPGAVDGEGIDAGVPAHYGRPSQEQWALAEGRGFTGLGHVAVVAVRGADRLTWLHSLSSQHLSALAPHVTTELLVLDPHGHVAHGALAVDDGTTTWLLTESSPAERAAGRTLADFLDGMRFAMRVEVDRRTDLTAVGVRSGGAADRALAADEALAGPPGAAGLPVWQDPWPRRADGTTTYGPAGEHPGADRPVTVRAVPRDALRAAAERMLAAGCVPAGTLAWEAERIAAWRPRVAAEADEKALPHELDWLRTSVHLAKGCYRGQETVARVVNLGKPPRRLTLLHLDGSAETLPAPGAPVLLGSRRVGVVTSAARHADDGPVALALVRRATDPAAPLRVGVEEPLIDAAQTVIVAPDGEPADRPVQPDRSGLRRRDLR